MESVASRSQRALKNSLDTNLCVCVYLVMNGVGDGLLEGDDFLAAKKGPIPSVHDNAKSPPFGGADISGMNGDV